MEFVYDDGGRDAYFKGSAGDCVVRAIAITLEEDYKEVYDSLAYLQSIYGKGSDKGKKSARDGVCRKAYDHYLIDVKGWKWTATMRPGSGCTVHLREEELPNGRIICRVSKHLCAVVDGVIHDTGNPSRGGTRCVYGYWQAG